MKLLSFIPVLILGVLLALPAPTLAAQSSASSHTSAQKMFHGVLDTYTKANTDLRLRVESRAGVLDDRTRTFLLALIRGEESTLLSLRSELYSTTSGKDVATLARKAKAQRDAMKVTDRQVIAPLLDVSELLGTLLPTAQQRLQGLDATLTKQRYDRLATTLLDIQRDAEQLQSELLSAKPPTNGSARVKQLNAKLKQFYSNVRSWIR